MLAGKFRGLHGFPAIKHLVCGLNEGCSCRPARWVPAALPSGQPSTFSAAAEPWESPDAVTPGFGCEDSR